MRWNGKTWKAVSTSTPSNSRLTAVSATSAHDAWAVGSYDTETGHDTLILHWDGKSWVRVSSPDPATFNTLAGVVAISADDAWAVGGTETTGNPAAGSTLIVHWDGTAWHRVASPSPGQDPFLHGITATSADNAWSVGDTANDDLSTTDSLILHWDGKSWQQQPSPNPDIFNRLFAVAATSATSAWAVGEHTDGGGPSVPTLMLHWNGAAWKLVRVPRPRTALTGLAAVSPANVWAVGTYGKSLIIHWDGTAWKRVPSPASGGLNDVSAMSATNAWAVGSDSGPLKIFHWNGRRWKCGQCRHTSKELPASHPPAQRNANG